MSFIRSLIVFGLLHLSWERGCTLPERRAAALRTQVVRSMTHIDGSVGCTTHGPDHDDLHILAEKATEFVNQNMWDSPQTRPCLTCRTALTLYCSLLQSSTTRRRDPPQDDVSRRSFHCPEVISTEGILCYHVFN